MVHTAPTETVAAEQPVAHGRTLVRSTLSGTFGTALEYYDFVIYGLAAATVFNALFFPEVSPTIGLLASFATYSVGFFARPVGGLILGALGDRIGRKAILVFTIVAMGLSTFAIGLLPTHAQIGIWAPLLLLLLRITQGFGAGAELASASTLLVESAPPPRRGLLGSLVCIGTNTGTLVASGVWLTVTMLPEDAFMSWGWRLPFLVSIGIAAWGLWIRRRVQESPTFTEVASEQQHKKFTEIYGGVITGGRKAFLSCFGLRIGEAGTSILYQVFLVGYIATLPGVDASTGTLAVVVASLVGYVTIPLVGYLIDKVGRRPVFRWLSGFQLAFAFPGIYLVNTGNTALILTAFILAFSTAVLGMYAIESAWMAEIFGSHHRLAGVTAAKELGGVLGGGIAPMVASALTAAFVDHWWPIAAYVALLAGVSFVSSLYAPETKGRNLLHRNDAI